MFMDFWYGFTKDDVKGVSLMFYPNEGEYRGNLYDKNGKVIGDFTTDDSLEIEKVFDDIVRF